MKHYAVYTKKGLTKYWASNKEKVRKQFKSYGVYLITEIF